MVVVCGENGGRFGASHKSFVVVYGKWKNAYMKERNQENDIDDNDEEKPK